MTRAHEAETALAIRETALARADVAAQPAVVARAPVTAGNDRARDTERRNVRNFASLIAPRDASRVPRVNSPPLRATAAERD